jgi:hypothetical protein
MKVVVFKLLANHCCRFESRQGLWILACEYSEAIQNPIKEHQKNVGCGFGI